MNLIKKTKIIPNLEIISRYTSLL